MQKQYLFPGAALVAVLSMDCAVGGGPVNSQESLTIEGGTASSSSGGNSSLDNGSTNNASGAANAGSDASVGDDGSFSVIGDGTGDDASPGATDDATGTDGTTTGAGATAHRDGGTKHDAGVSSGGTTPDSGSSGGGATAPSTLPAGWLYTSGNKIFASDGNSGGTQWMGRGVNMDDIFFCGYDNTLWMSSPDQTLETIASGLISNWNPTFIRMSLAMDSYTSTVSWTGDTATYATPMTNAINAITANPNVYLLVTVRSDPSMIGQDTSDGDPEATGLPSDSTTTPDATKYPTGTDATYVALVDAFANNKSVLFGLTNEPGGDKLSNATIASAMNHAVGTIRAEEDRLGVPHHIVSVQGNGWTSVLDFYAASPAPITYDNVVYELHYYPSLGATASTYQSVSSLPMIIGEYGGFSATVTQSGFYADMEANQIPNLAWDFEPYSNCTPDLLNVTGSTTLTASAWGSTVQQYLLAH
jgi:hypothetical protein